MTAPVAPQVNTDKPLPRAARGRVALNLTRAQEYRLGAFVRLVAGDREGYALNVEHARNKVACARALRKVVGK